MKNPTPSHEKVRNSNFEVLRILSMLLVVLAHACTYGGFEYAFSGYRMNRLFVEMGWLGNLGVAVYVIISGYFLSGKPAGIPAMSRLFSQVWFYSMGLFLLFRLGFGVEYSGEALLKVLFPTVFSEYWFFTVYIILAFLSPYLNMLTESMNRKVFQRLLAGLLLLWSVIPLLTGQHMYGAEVPQFVMLYLLGAWFRRNPDGLLCRAAVRWSLIFGAAAVLLASSVLADYCGAENPKMAVLAEALYSRGSPAILTCAVGLFAQALYRKPFSSRWINTLSGCTFGVYLIHENPAVRRVLWSELCGHVKYYASASLIPRMLLSVVSIFLICAAVEFLRQKTVAGKLAAAVEAGLLRLCSCGNKTES